MPRHEAERALLREDFAVVYPVTTRWSDNDMFGHLNNAVYYQLFDTAINGWLAGVAGDDPVTARVIGVVAESRCVFFGELAFPQPVAVALRVARLGRTSVSYDLGLFGEGTAPIAAYGQWTHVYVDRETRLPTEPPAAFREAFESARGPGGEPGR